MTHIDAEGHEVVRVEEVVRDRLSQVEGQLDELEGGAGIRGGEDDPASVVHHRYVCRQYNLSIKIDSQIFKCFSAYFVTAKPPPVHKSPSSQEHETLCGGENLKTMRRKRKKNTSKLFHDAVLGKKCLHISAFMWVHLRTCRPQRFEDESKSVFDSTDVARVGQTAEQHERCLHTYVRQHHSLLPPSRNMQHSRPTVSYSPKAPEHTTCRYHWRQLARYFYYS